MAILESVKLAARIRNNSLDEEIDRLADTARACIVYRNSDSAEGINGLAIDFPYKDLTMYSTEYE